MNSIELSVGRYLYQKKCELPGIETMKSIAIGLSVLRTGHEEGRVLVKNVDR